MNANFWYTYCCLRLLEGSYMVKDNLPKHPRDRLIISWYGPTNVIGTTCWLVKVKTTQNWVANWYLRCLERKSKKPYTSRKLTNYHKEKTYNNHFMPGLWSVFLNSLIEQNLDITLQRVASGYQVSLTKFLLPDIS